MESDQLHIAHEEQAGRSSLLVAVVEIEVASYALDHLRLCGESQLTESRDAEPQVACDGRILIIDGHIGYASLVATLIHVVGHELQEKAVALSEG